jgi:hypothetical protein
MIDLDLKALPSNIREDEIKKIANVKHVVSVVVETDSITN